MAITKTLAVLCATLAGASLDAATAAALGESLEAPRLLMVNGDYYSGQLADCDEPGVVSWQCDDVVGPFRFPLAAVSAAHFQREGQPERPAGDFCVELFGGDALFGSLVAMTADEVVLDTQAFGRVHIDRAQVQRLQPWGAKSGIEYLGPDGLRGWKPIEPKSQWREEAGHPLNESPGRLWLESVAIPPQASIEVELSWQRKADFSLQFGSVLDPDLKEFAKRVAEVAGRPGAVMSSESNAAASAFELTVWGEAVVLVREQPQEADLNAIKDLPKGPGRLSLRLHFDQEAGVVAAYTLEGKFLTSVKAAGDPKQALKGVTLVNSRGDIRLERLMIRRWGGVPPAKVTGERAYIQVRDGGVHFASDATFDAQQQEFVVAGEAGERRIPVADIVCLMMPINKNPPGFGLRLSLHDGARLNGDLQKVENGRLVIARSGIANPLEIPVELIQSLVGQRPQAPRADQNDETVARLETPGSSSHGALVTAEPSPDGSCLAWCPVGSSVGQPLRDAASGRIVYHAPRPEQAQKPVPPRRTVAERNRGVWGALLRPAQARGPQREPGSYEQLLWLRAGDRIPCRVTSIDERGVTFATPLLDATFVPHDSIKAWDRRAGTQPRALEDDKRARLLTLPRMQRENPPTHLIESVGGDFLRGRLESMDDKVLRIEVRLETKEIPRDSIDRIIWLSEKPEGAPSDSDSAPPGDVAATDDAPDDQLRVQAVCNDGIRLTFLPERFADGVLRGVSPLLGPCAVPVAVIDELYFGKGIASAAEQLAYSSWRLRAAPDPRYIAEDGQTADPTLAGTESTLVGQPAPDFTLDLLDGGRFHLAQQKGRVVVLDFWASWCGWCMQSMPALDEMADGFGDSVTWVAVNLQEDRKTIQAALERLGVDPRVALDIDGATAEKFGVTAIPQTVVIDAQGKVARVFIGGGPNLVDQLRTAIDQAVNGNDAEAASGE